MTAERRTDSPDRTVSGEDTRITERRGDTEAVVKGIGPDEIESGLVDQITEFVNHEAFQNRIRVMPDAHIGAGAPIGFTMGLGDRIVPKTVGVDVGCGMLAGNIGHVSDLDDRDLAEIDEEIRESVPMGRSVHFDTDYHIGDDFPWDVCEQKRQRIDELVDFDVDTVWFDGYDVEYFKSLLRKIGYDTRRAINSLGTLGGGNHFIELAEARSDGSLWCVIHSGSRGPGASIAEHWQQRATDRREREWIRQTLDDELEPYLVPDTDDIEIAEWFRGGKGQSYIDSEAIRAEYDGEKIGAIHDRIREAHPQNRPGGEDLDYLEGEEAAGYLIDMIFAQTYASVSRQRMLEAVCDVLDTQVEERIESVHNYIDFDDGVIRKGACRAHDGEHIVIPLNMADGTIIARGKGNPEWNRSAPHGAGRLMSRTEAYDTLDVEAFQASMDGVFSSTINENVIDESPMAYKDAEQIRDAIEPTAELVDHLDPVINLKAEE